LSNTGNEAPPCGVWRRKEPGKIYQLETSTTLAPDDWQEGIIPDEREIPGVSAG
jgi:hypothetical protein